MNNHHLCTNKSAPPTAAERWSRYEDKFQDHDDGGLNWGVLTQENEPIIHKSFGIRRDCAVIVFDEDGYFTMEWMTYGEAQQKNPVILYSGEPHHTEDMWIYAVDPDGTPHDVWCEPIFLATFLDDFWDMFSSEKG